MLSVLLQPTTVDHTLNSMSGPSDLFYTNGKVTLTPKLWTQKILHFFLQLLEELMKVVCSISYSPLEKLADKESCDKANVWLIKNWIVTRARLLELRPRLSWIGSSCLDLKPGAPTMGGGQLHCIGLTTTPLLGLSLPPPKHPIGPCQEHPPPIHFESFQ